MDAPAAKLPLTRKLLTLFGVAILATAACAPGAVAPTAAPPKPAPTAAPAQPAPTTAPAKVEAPTAKPAPTAAPAAKPTEKPAAKAAEFDEKAVADFYRGKTIRIVVGYGAGGATDTNARLLQKVLSKYIPGNPSIVVENKPGGGGMLTANTVYNTEPKDGTVIASITAGLVLEQALGGPGVQYDAAKYQWLGSTYESPVACGVRTDSGVTGMQELVNGGKELTMGSYGKGTPSYNPPAVMNAVLGTKFKIVTGYEGDAQQLLALKNKEVQAWCTTFETVARLARDILEGSNPLAKLIVVTGDKTPDDPLLKGVPAVETLARTDEARAMLKAIHVPFLMNIPHTMAPEVPKDRVAANRRARDRAFVDPEFLAAAQQAQLNVSPRTGEDVTRLVQEMLNTPPATLAKLKQVLE